MKADPFAQLRLLDLQALDSTLDRLSHRRRSLPEHQQVEDLETRITELRNQVVMTSTEDGDLAREQSKVDADVDLVRQRMARDQQRLDSGAVGSPKELENLQSEIASLHKRQTDLEDVELEVMERREAVQNRLAELQTAHEAALAELEATTQRRDSTLAEIETEATTTKSQRGELAGGLPADLLALYDKVRASSGGVGAAALHRGRCEGCHLQLNTTDLNTLRDAPSDEVVRCEECRRILVRTAESGL